MMYVYISYKSTHRYKATFLLYLSIYVEAQAFISYKWLLTQCLNQSSIYSDLTIYFLRMYKFEARLELKLLVRYSSDVTSHSRAIYSHLYRGTRGVCFITHKELTQDY